MFLKFLQLLLILEAFSTPDNEVIWEAINQELKRIQDYGYHGKMVVCMLKDCITGDRVENNITLGDLFCCKDVPQLFIPKEYIVFWSGFANRRKDGEIPF